MGIRKIRTRSGKTKYRAELQRKGKRASKVFNDQLDAAVWYDAKEKEFETGVVPDGEVGSDDMFFDKAVDKFIVESRQIVSRAQIKNYENSQKILTRSFGENKKMSELTHQDVATHVLKRMTDDGVGPSSIRNELSLIRSVFRKACDWGINYPSPEASIKRPKAKMRSREDRSDRVIKINELNAIFEEAQKRDNNLYYYLRFLLFTGMRPSEAALLYWTRLPVTEEREAIKQKYHVGYVDLHRAGFSHVGTKTETRFVPAHQEAIKIIEILKEKRKKNQRLVFLDDKYIDRDDAYKYYRRTMRTTIKNARIDEDTPLRGNINFYSFRHTARTNMSVCGIPTEIAETIIGHNDKSFKFTYIHVSDDDLISAITKLNYPGLRR